MQCVRWLTEAKQIADLGAVSDGVHYIMPTGDYTEFEDEAKGYAVVSAVEVGKLWQRYTKEQRDLPSSFCVRDYIADECIYASGDGVDIFTEPEPEREEIEHYLADYHTDHYQRDMPTGDYTFGLLFYAKVNPAWSDKIEGLVDQIRESELSKSGSGDYQYAVKTAIEKRIDNMRWATINWAYECWEEQVKNDYHWIQDVGRVGRSGGHIKIISSWPETTDELQQILLDCATIEKGIRAEIKWLESEEFRLTEYRAAFGIDEEIAELATV